MSEGNIRLSKLAVSSRTLSPLYSTDIAAIIQTLKPRLTLFIFITVMALTNPLAHASRNTSTLYQA